jgi:hypothetical protein
MIELFLSTDGKHTVHVTAETPEEMATLVPEAKTLYQDVLRTYGTKPQLWSDAMHRTGNGQALVGKRIDTVAQAHQAVAPVCPVHQTPMAYRQGKRGPFWSCHERMPDGQWCTVTQPVTKASHPPLPAA